MRRVIAVFLLAMLPFQFVWGAAATYCQHEEGSNVAHFSHHVHKHQGKKLKLSDDSSPEKGSSPGGDDPDCAGCHASCNAPVMHASLGFSPTVPSPMFAVASRSRPPHIVNTIERPNWVLAA